MSVYLYFAILLYLYKIHNIMKIYYFEKIQIVFLFNLIELNCFKSNFLQLYWNIHQFNYILIFSWKSHIQKSKENKV